MLRKEREVPFAHGMKPGTAVSSGPDAREMFGDYASDRRCICSFTRSFFFFSSVRAN